MNFVEKLRRTPVIYSLAATTTIVTTIAALYTGIRELFGFSMLPLTVLDDVAYIVLIIFLVFLAHQYRQHTKTGPLGKDFAYGNDGVLWHGSEKAIAFRVITFLALLEQVGDQLSEKDRHVLFADSGRESGRDFGKQLGTQIYPSEIKKDGPNFTVLPMKARLELWSEYDSSTGWGMFEVQEKAKSLSIVVKHSTLFDGKGGKDFAYYLAGYSETVANAITKDFGCEWIFVNDLGIHEGVVEISLNAKQ